MSALTVCPDNQPQLGETTTDFTAIQTRLGAIGVQFERWTANCELAADADQDTVIDAYSDSIDRLKQQYAFQSVDVISLNPDHPDKAVFGRSFCLSTSMPILKCAFLSKVAACFTCTSPIKCMAYYANKAI